MSEMISAKSSTRSALLSLRGRLGRVEFIAYSVSYALAATLSLSALGYFLLLFPISLARTWYSVAAVVMINLLLPLMLAILAIKRLHDIGKPAWLAFLLLIPLANFLFMLMLWAWPGETRVNAYGDEPGIPSTFVLVAAIVLPLLLLAGFLSSGPLGGTMPQAPALSTVPALSVEHSSDSLRPYSK